MYWWGGIETSAERPRLSTPCEKSNEADRGVKVVLSAGEDGGGHGVEEVGKNALSEQLYSPEAEAVASIGVDEGGSCWGIYYDNQIDPA